MTEKLDKLSNDILTLLKNVEPNRLRHHEICDSLWKTYQISYKDKKSFGVAVSQKLSLLKTAKLITHEDIWYGTPNSTIPKTEAEKPKPSAETFMLPNPNLTEKERKLYRYDVEYLSLLKQMANPSNPEWDEFLKQEEREFKLKWGMGKA
ncbi:MAG: hypothetical protein QXV01_11270 [Candidatus Bathyarchaeia archaeon]